MSCSRSHPVTSLEAPAYLLLSLSLLVVIQPSPGGQKGQSVPPASSLGEDRGQDERNTGHTCRQESFGIHSLVEMCTMNIVHNMCCISNSRLDCCFPTSSMVEGVWVVDLRHTTPQNIPVCAPPTLQTLMHDCDRRTCCRVD